MMYALSKGVCVWQDSLSLSLDQWCKGNCPQAVSLVDVVDLIVESLVESPVDLHVDPGVDPLVDGLVDLIVE